MACPRIGTRGPRQSCLPQRSYYRSGSTAMLSIGSSSKVRLSDEDQRGIARLCSAGGEKASLRRKSRLQDGIPIEIIHPAFVQIIGRKPAAVLVQIVDGWLIRHPRRPHAGLAGAEIALAQIAARTGGDDIFPGRGAALGAGHEMVEGQILAGAAILAAEAVAEKDIEPSEGGMARGSYIASERNHRREPHLEARTSDRLVIIGNDVHPVEEHRLDRILPRPKRERIVAQWPEVGIEHERRTGLGGNPGLGMHRHVSYLA